MCLGLSGHISTSFRCTPVTHGSALTSLNLGCTRHSRSTLHSALICTRFPGTRALCVTSCPVKTRGKLSHHIGAPRRSGAWKALLLVTEGNALGPHVRPISICLEGSTPQDRTSPRSEIYPTRPNPCFKRNMWADANHQGSNHPKRAGLTRPKKKKSQGIILAISCSNKATSL